MTTDHRSDARGSGRGTPGPDTWWRRNRLALGLLPVVTVLALAASSSRVEPFWWDAGFHARAEVTDATAHLVDTYDDGVLQYSIEARYRLAGVRPARPAELADSPLPEGLAAWAVTLEVEADPESVLVGCTVGLVDTDGALYRADDAVLLAGTSWGQSRCVPEDAPGPRYRPFSTAPPERPPGTPRRPSDYTVTTVVATPEDVEIDAVRVWYGLPTYVELPVDRVSDASGVDSSAVRSASRS